MEYLPRFGQNFRRRDEDPLLALIDPDKIEMGQKLIEEGVEEDSLNKALYVACERGYTDWIYMLLYYGADPNIPSPARGLPIAAIRGEDEFLRDILTLYTIDNRSLSLRTLIAALREETSWFCKVLESVSEVDYDEEDEDFVYDNMLKARPSNVKLFIEKFPSVFQHISQDLAERGFFYFLLNVLRLQDDNDVVHYKDFIDIFLYNSGIAELYTSGIERRYSMVAVYVDSLSRHFPEEEITERVLLLMTYGLRVNFLDLEVVYVCYGYCDLFEILLNMDPENSYNRGAASPFILLYHDPRLTIESCFEDPLSLLLLLDLYNDTKLKRRCLTLLEDCHYNVGFQDWDSLSGLSNDTWHGADWYVLNILRGDTFLNRVRKMPQVSSLVELSRNVARKYIVDKFKIRTSRELHTVLNGLPIDKLTKDTIKLRLKLY